MHVCACVLVVTSSQLADVVRPKHASMHIVVYLATPQSEIDDGLVWTSMDMHACLGSGSVEMRWLVRTFADR